jgi:hypothetical protein
MYFSDWSKFQHDTPLHLLEFSPKQTWNNSHVNSLELGRLDNLFCKKNLTSAKYFSEWIS